MRLKQELDTLAVFRELREDEILCSLSSYLECLTDAPEAAAGAYSRFVGELYEANGGDLAAYLRGRCEVSENIYVRTLGAGNTPPAVIRRSLERELAILDRVAALTPEELTEPMDAGLSLPEFTSEGGEISSFYAHRTENIGKYGYGKYARNRMFYLDGEGQIVPVQSPDGIRLSDLVDYEDERRRIVDNTKALLAGRPAANILLTGDAGTGKSSTVKAVGNEFFGEGLRIIEVRKDQLAMIPALLDELAGNPLKFILFIDDLSFAGEDDRFNGLKAVLEGSVAARSHNVVVYATSNRRHLVRERFADRDGDEVRRNDTLQEIVSLSNRFGIQITFQRPDKKTYLHIVSQLAGQKGVVMDDAELAAGAERYALERGGRSARLAKQYIEGILSRE